jgi:hypothetical protein
MQSKCDLSQDFFHMAKEGDLMLPWSCDYFIAVPGTFDWCAAPSERRQLLPLLLPPAAAATCCHLLLLLPPAATCCHLLPPAAALSDLHACPALPVSYAQHYAQGHVSRVYRRKHCLRSSGHLNRSEARRSSH